MFQARCAGFAPILLKGEISQIKTLLTEKPIIARAYMMISWCICTIQDLLCSNKQTHQLENCLNKPSDISKVWSLIIVIIIIAIKLTKITAVQRLQNSMFHRQNPDTVISIFMTQILRQLWKKPKLFQMNQNCSKLYYVYSLKPNPNLNPTDHYCFNIVLICC